MATNRGKRDRLGILACKGLQRSLDPLGRRARSGRLDAAYRRQNGRFGAIVVMTSHLANLIGRSREELFVQLRGNRRDDRAHANADDRTVYANLRREQHRRNRRQGTRKHLRNGQVVE